MKPVNLQLYPRNITTNNGTVVISGSVSGGSATQMRVRVLRNGIEISVTAPQSVAGGVNFNFPIDILSEMAQYSFVPSLNTGVAGSFVDWPTIATNVVAGDAIIIQGQSNAGASENWSGDPMTAAYNNAASSYIRVLGSGDESLSTGDVAGLTWALGDGNAGPESNANVGQWGYVLVNKLITQTGKPIAVFNGAHGGKGIEFFAKNHDPSDDDNDYGSNLNNYTRLYARVQKAGFLNAIRAIFWFQGESDADDAWRPKETAVSYKDKWDQMYADWQSDYTTTGQKVYINQIRHGCNGETERTKFINEALRQAYLDHPSETRIYGTGALQQEPDGDEGPGAPKFCHFEFIGGYEKLGNDWYPVVLSDLYNETLPGNSLSPFVISINKPSETQITLTFANSDPLTITTDALSNFRFEGAASQPGITPSISGNTITLNLTAFPAGTTGLSYYDRDNHRGNDDPDIVTTTNKLAIVNFTNQAIILGAFPVKLLNFGGLWKNANEIDLNWSVTDEKDMSGYDILYSTDGSNFRKVGFSKASNTPLIKQYSFRHEGSLAPINYYRLKMIDLDGTVTYSAIINIKNKETGKSFAVSVNPNPVINDAQIYIQSEKAEKAEIVIANGMGQQVAFFSRNIQQGLSTITVSKNKLTGKGVYFVRVRMAEKTVTTKFFIAN